MIGIPKLSIKPKFRVLVYGSALSLPIIIYSLEMLLTRGLLPVGDADYLMQTVLASNISILDHGQFPWWNPWVSGGVPLFANPQFGLLALPTLLGLIFGPVMGYKLAILAYLLFGFYGLLMLFRKGLSTNLVTAILLAYIWTFGSFLAYRSFGHYTFLTIQFFPWIIYFFLARNRIRYSWAYFGIFAGLAALAAAHNMTILGYLLIAMIVVVDIFALKFQRVRSALRLQATVISSDLIFLTKAAAVFVLITFYRLFFTLDYLSDYPRSQVDNPEPTLGLIKGLFAIGGPLRQFDSPPMHPQWSWMEASAYIGVTTCVAALVILFVAWKARKKGKWRDLFTYNPFKVVAVGTGCFLLGLGNYIGSLSPYSLMRHLPILSSMRVASRWLIFSSLMLLLFIAIYKGRKYRTAINVLLAVAVIELFLFSRPQLAKPYLFSARDEPGENSFQQKVHYNTKRGEIPYDENLTEATQNNYGQIIAGDSLIDTRPGTPYQLTSARCPVDKGCNLVLSNNANAKEWTPNGFALERTGPGDIILNMNPGKGWLVNDVYVFANMRVVEPSAEFRIKDKSENISVTMQPRFSVEWAWWKITK